MEKRRRARINASLTELKSLLQEAIKKEGARHNKMEKADILEMAVKHLRQIQRQQVTDNLADKYSLGYSACAQEVSKYLDDDVDLKTKLLNHLANCITGAGCSSSSPSSSPSMEPSPRAPLSALLSASLPATISPPSSGAASPSSTTLSPELQRSLHLDVKQMVTSSSSMKNMTFSGLTSFEQRLQNFIVPQHSANSRLENSPSKANEFYNSNSNVCSSSTPSSENVFSVLVNGAQVSATRLGVADINNNSGKSGGDIGDGTSVAEVNNNSIVAIPTVIGLRGTTASLQQPHQQQLQIQPVQQVQQFSGISIDPHQQQAILHDSGILANRLQFLPIKTASGETAFVLSAANLVNPSQLSGYTFQVYTPPSQQPVFTQPYQPQQPLQIAVAFPQEEHQPAVTYIPQVNQPYSAVVTGAFDLTQAKSAVGLFDNQSAPLNLTSSNPRPAPPQAPSSRYSVMTPEQIPTNSSAYLHQDQRNAAVEDCPNTAMLSKSVYYRLSPGVASTDADTSQEPTSSMPVSEMSMSYTDPRAPTAGSPMEPSLYPRHMLDYHHKSDNNGDLKRGNFFRPW